MVASKEANRKEFEVRKSLQEAGVIKIVAELGEEGNRPTTTTIIIEHNKGDKEPIRVPITFNWYGDERDSFKVQAAKYFEAEDIYKLDREIGAIYKQVIDQQQEEEEKRSIELIQKAKAEVSAEIERSRQALLGQLPISVSEAFHTKDNSSVVVYGQISAMYKKHDVIEGATYECMNCGGPNYIHFPRPFNREDECPPSWYDRCTICERTPLSEEEKKNAKVLRYRFPKYMPALRVELMDVDTYEDIDTLPVMFFGEESKGVKVGERVRVRGKIHVLPAGGKKSGLLHHVLYAHTADYEDRETYEPSTEDIARVERFARITSKNGANEDGIIEWLVKMYAPPVIWNEFAKEGMLYMEASAGPDTISKRKHGSKRRRRILGGLIGTPGQGKSTLLETPSRHDKRNRYASGTSSTGKTLTAVASKEADGVVLRVGELSKAKEAVICINEFPRIPIEDQSNFLDAGEEGEFTYNKLGLHARIRADAVIIWSGNPSQAASWSNNSGDARISIDDIPVLKEFIDRSDILVIYKPVDPIKEPEKYREFSRLKTEMERHPERVPNYDEYVKTHLMVAKRYNPILNEDASLILGEAHVRIQQAMWNQGLPNAGSWRVMDKLIRITENIARLKLKKIADEKDAKHAVQFYNTMYSQVHSVISMPDNPRDLAYKEILYLYQNESKGQPIAYRTCVEEACRRRLDVDAYFKGGAKNIRDNWQMQTVRKLLENHSKIKRVPPMSPVTFKWVGGEQENGPGGKKGEESTSKSQGRSDASDASDEVRDTPQRVQTDQQKPKEPAEESKTNPRDTVLTPSLASLPSPLAENEGNIQLEDNEEYKVLKSMEIAMLDYKADKVAEGRESGSMFTAHDVWYHLATMFPGREWGLDKVRKVIRQQIKKGRVITRHEDEPDRYYLVWRSNDGGDGGDNGNSSSNYNNSDSSSY
jgi:DNA replicative helicase MCM subunit Mcm2 (Cdc46/Mcm family)